MQGRFSTKLTRFFFACFLFLFSSQISQKRGRRDRRKSGNTRKYFFPYLHPIGVKLSLMPGILLFSSFSRKRRMPNLFLSISMYLIIT